MINLMLPHSSYTTERSIWLWMDVMQIPYNDWALTIPSTKIPSTITMPDNIVIDFKKYFDL